MTDSLLTLLAVAGPALLAATALIARAQPGRAPRTVLAAARLGSMVALVSAGAAVLRVALFGPATTPLLGVNGIGFALRFDALSVIMFALVAIMGGVVLRFSRAYLDGDARHGAFVGRMALTVASVMLLVLSGNLLHLSAFWAITSFSLHGLLVFYSDRRGAVMAARKKFIVARAGDVLLAAAAVLIWQSFGTADLAELAARAAAFEGPADLALSAAALMIVLSAALKSAMIPTHGWLLDVMETPTPVSALLHAGIINGGTFLIVRLADVVLHVPFALHLAVLIGATTAVVASVVLTTQPAVKTALAWSSAAHMGFMLMLCGLGAFPVAILHLVAHSFYKAHAFLSSGSAAEVTRARKPAAKTPASWGEIALGFTASAATVAAVGTLLGIDFLSKPVTVGLSTVIAIALTQLWAGGFQARSGGAVVLGRVVTWATATTLAFWSLELTAATLLAGAVPVEPLADPATIALTVLVVLAFASVVAVQLRLPALVQRPAFRRLWVHTRNGFYLNTRFDRLVGTWKTVDLSAPSARIAR